MCSLCAVTTCPHYQATSGLSIGALGDQCIIDHVPGPGIDPSSCSQFVSSLSQIEVPRRLSESLCYERSHTQQGSIEVKICSSLNHMSSAQDNYREVISALPPPLSSSSNLRSWRVDFAVGLGATVTTELTAGCVPSWDVRNVACSSVDNTWSVCFLVFILGVFLLLISLVFRSVSAAWSEDCFLLGFT